jgi:hypothetical protein
MLHVTGYGLQVSFKTQNSQFKNECMRCCGSNNRRKRIKEYWKIGRMEYWKDEKLGWRNSVMVKR